MWLGAAVALAAIIAVAAWYVRAARTPSAADGPIILISIDTLRADHLPVYGYKGVRTPNIDALAAGATVFEHAYSHTPQTLPAHTAILSGELPFQTGVRDNIGFKVKDGQWMVQRALHEHGWQTGGFVSAYVLRDATGIGQGFDTYDSNLPAASPELSLGQVQRDGAQTLAAAETWLGARTSDRVFLFVHFYEPHKPYEPPARFSSYAPYDGEIAYADELVGRLLDRLKTDGLYDRSTIVLLADHGEGLGDHGEQEHGLFLYQETTHVPMIVKLPGQHEGRRVANPVQHIDLVPTILDLVGIPSIPDLHGRSLRPVLDGSGTLPDTGIYAEALYSRYHFGWSELYSLTDSRYRLIRAPRDELYDLQRDPGERTSLAADRPQVRQAMRSALEGLIAGSSIDAPTEVSAEDRQRLAALGYVGSGTAASLALPGDELPDPKDKVGILEKYREALDVAGRLQFDKAIAMLQDVVREDPGMLDVWEQLGDLLLRDGRFAEALDAYKALVQRDPTNVSGLTGAANALLRLQRYDEARAHAQLAVAGAPVVSHQLLTRIALEQGDRDAALREADLAHKADPSLPMRPFAEGVLLWKAGRYAEAIPPLLEARRQLEGRTLQINDLNYYLGDSMGRLERYPEAERYLKEEIRVFPRNTRARAGLAMLYRATGRDAESDRAVVDLLRVAPTREGRSLAIQLWTMFGEPEKAEIVRRKGPASVP